jgi:hypothetical protein
MSENIATLENADMLTVKGNTNKATPRMQMIFMKQLPMILPRAKSICPFLMELILVASSGMLVPNATTVAPITTSGTPMLSAMIAKHKLGAQTLAHNLTSNPGYEGFLTGTSRIIPLETPKD